MRISLYFLAFEEILVITMSGICDMPSHWPHVPGWLARQLLTSSPRHTELSEMLLVTGFLTSSGMGATKSLLTLPFKVSLTSKRSQLAKHMHKKKKKKKNVPQHSHKLLSEHLSHLNKEPDI